MAGSGAAVLSVECVWHASTTSSTRTTNTEVTEVVETTRISRAGHHLPPAPIHEWSCLVFFPARPVVAVDLATPKALQPQHSASTRSACGQHTCGRRGTATPFHVHLFFGFGCGNPPQRRVLRRNSQGTEPRTGDLDPIHSTRVLGLLAGTSLCHLRARGWAWALSSPQKAEPRARFAATKPPFRRASLGD